MKDLIELEKKIYETHNREMRFEERFLKLLKDLEGD